MKRNRIIDKAGSIPNSKTAFPETDSSLHVIMPIKTRSKLSKSENANGTVKPSHAILTSNCLLPTAKGLTTKHTTTPMKTRSKTSKCEEDDDVHSVMKSPVTPNSRLSKSKSSSPLSSNHIPYYLGLCSQELPEVVWDYNSPKARKNCERQDTKTTIDDLLNNINDSNQGSPSDNQSSSTKLFEKWMTYRNMSPVIKKGLERLQAKMPKKRSHELKEMLAVFDSIAEDNSNSSREPAQELAKVTSQPIEKIAASIPRELRKIQTSSSLDDDSNGFISDDELWGEESFNDNVLIVKATQEFESCLISRNSQPKGATVPMSRDPSALVASETFPANDESESVHHIFNCDTVTVPKFGPYHSCDNTRDLPKDECDQQTNEENAPKDDSEEMIINNGDWDLSNDSDWNDDSLMMLDALSRIPDDALNSKTTDTPASSADEKATDRERKSDSSTCRLLCNETNNQNVNSDIQRPFLQSVIVDNENQLFTDSDEIFSVFNSERFNDCFESSTSIMAKEMEVMSSQRSISPKYTADEIAQKKQEALKRLKERKRNKSSNL